MGAKKNRKTGSIFPSWNLWLRKKMLISTPQTSVSGIGLVPGRNILCYPNLLTSQNLYSLQSCRLLSEKRYYVNQNKRELKLDRDLALALSCFIGA